MAKKKKKSPILRLFLAMFIGLFIIETMIELSTGTTLMGGRNGIFISPSHPNAKIDTIAMKARGRIITATDIHDGPFFDTRTVGKLEVGATVRVLGKTTADREVWYQMQRFGGKIGYISANTVAVK